jgi:hypothetical protein
MEIIEVSRKALVLDSSEIEKMDQAYQYLRHRLLKHPECGLKLDIKYVDYVIAKLKEVR